MSIAFSPEQQSALAKATAWFAGQHHGANQVFRLFGYAGTGKTTIAQELAKQVAGNQRVLFAAFTGKAAYVMGQRGCPGATTIHRLIYKPSGRSHQTLMELQKKLEDLCAIDPQPIERIEQVKKLIQAEEESVSRPSFILNVESEVHQCALVVIDECSMVDQRMGLDLLSFQKPVLVLGDPAQLPPVRGEGFFTAATPDITLTQIHRQASGNPIIALATTVRMGRPLPPGDHGSSQVGKRSDFCKATLDGIDQVIVGRNATRRQFNTDYRRWMMGITDPMPVPGDKLVCLRNNHELGLLNGGQWIVEEVALPEETGTGYLHMRIRDNDITQVVSAHADIFNGIEVPWYEKRDAEEFDYGYALTCHKSQGSQWENVLVLDESESFRENAQQWLYTAITRASKRIIVLK